MDHSVDLCELYMGFQRSIKRKIPKQEKIKDLLPSEDFDFMPLFETIVPENMDEPQRKFRTDMENHWIKLQYKYRGQPKILPFHMLLISYMRRDTPVTERATKLFHRLWAEHSEQLLEIMKLRDIVSALRSFADRPADPVQRLLAKLSFTYAHMIKLYESERSAEKGDLKRANYSVPGGCPNIGIKGFAGVQMGGDNSFEITQILLAEELNTDPVLGPMILIMLEKIKNGTTIFSRYDQARIASDFRLDQDTDWSFGLNPTEENSSIAQAVYN